MPTLTCDIPSVLQAKLDEQSKRTGESVSAVVTNALSRYLDVPLHTLFQISTSGALVEGIYGGVVSSNLLLHHGDFGLGTFEHLDGEMVILDGAVFQVRSDGTVKQVTEDSRTPFAVVLHFVADREQTLEKVESLDALMQSCDRLRDSQNLFYAFRIDGHFSTVRTRAMRAASGHLRLAQAAALQPEFTFVDIEGTLVGLWSPAYSKSINIPGYHFHFLSKDRAAGGHLLSCRGDNLVLQIERLDAFRLSLPESEEFLKADLHGDPSKDLAYAEHNHETGEGDGK